VKQAAFPQGAAVAPRFDFGRGLGA
jgi:hypothetical protein